MCYTPTTPDYGTTTYFLYDGTSPVVEETASGSTATLTALNVLAADGVRARYFPTLGSQFYSFTFDPQGSQVGSQYSANTFDPVYAVSSFEAYGHRGAQIDNGGHNPPSNQSPFQFGGQFGYYTDTDTGLLCLTHRYFDPGTGKFINRDPICYGGRFWGRNQSLRRGFTPGSAGRRGSGRIRHRDGRGRREAECRRRRSRTWRAGRRPI